MALLRAFLVISCLAVVVLSRGPRRPGCLNDQVYEVVVELVGDRFHIPCSEKTTFHRTAIQYYRRNRNRLEVRVSANNRPTLYLDEYLVLKKSDVSKFIEKRFRDGKGAGARTINHQLKRICFGASEKNVQKVLSKLPLKHRLNLKFKNQVPITPISAKRVMERIQIDLVDLSKSATFYAKVKYSYILSIQDTFSRYTWLRPLTGKSSKLVAYELQNMFKNFGYPMLVQHDQGPEFRGKVDELLKSLKIVNICSSPYHPQSQGKIERMHRVLKRMMNYDLFTTGERGVNWVTNLPKYEQRINDAPKEVLNYATPFQVYFGRPRVLGQKKSTSAATLRKAAKKATERCNKRVINYQAKTMSYVEYLIGDKVFAKLHNKAARVSSKIKAVPGVIIKRNLFRHKYKVRFEQKDKLVSKWFSVKDITANTVQLQKTREAGAKNRKVLLTPKPSIRNGLEHNFENIIVFNPDPFGNCQFDAISHQLSLIGKDVNALSLRANIVNYLKDNRYLGSQEDVEWAESLEESRILFLNRMNRSGTYGDQLTLQATSEIYAIQIIVASSMRGGATLIHPSGSNVYDFNIPTIIIGHYSEGDGEHYVSLNSSSQTVQDILETSTQIQSLDRVDHESYSEIQSVTKSAKNLSSISTPNSSDSDKSVEDDIKNENDTLNYVFVVSAKSPAIVTYIDDRETVFENMAISHETQSEIVQIPFALWNVWEKILHYAISRDPITKQKLKCVNRYFHNILMKTKNPEVHLNPSVAADLSLPKFKCSVATKVSVRKLAKVCGRGSGVMLSIKNVIACNGWFNAWLVLVALNRGWFEIVRMYFRK